MDEKGDFPRRCNTEMVKLCPLDDEAEIAEVQAMIRRHAEHTNSDRAQKILASWRQMVPKFVKVYPNDYRRVIETQKRYRDQGLPEEQAIMAAFEENAHDLGGWEEVMPPLKPLHADEALSKAKLETFARASTQELIDSLRPGQQGSLKTKPDGTMIDGHHRIKILRDGGVDVDSLPREVIPKDDTDNAESVP